jgi:hypothetical protein
VLIACWPVGGRVDQHRASASSQLLTALVETDSPRINTESQNTNATNNNTTNNINNTNNSEPLIEVCVDTSKLKESNNSSRERSNSEDVNVDGSDQSGSERNKNRRAAGGGGGDLSRFVRKAFERVHSARLQQFRESTVQYSAGKRFAHASVWGGWMCTILGFFSSFSQGLWVACVLFSTILRNSLSLGLCCPRMFARA